MKRVFSLLTVITIGVIFISDVDLLMKYIKKPGAFSLLENVSFIHYFILHENGIAFSLLKMAFSCALLFLWAKIFIYPSRVEIIKYATFVYSLVWMLIGALVLTGVSGLLQFSAGLNVKLFDLRPLFVAMDYDDLAVLVLMSVGLPLMLLFLPRLHNRWQLLPQTLQLAASDERPAG